MEPVALKRPCKLGRRQAFLRVQAQGQRFRGQHIGMLMAGSEVAGPARVGFTTSRKVGNAVVRNKVRRRLREIVRLEPALLHNGYEYVVIAYPQAGLASYAMLHEELTCLMRRARTWVLRRQQPSA